MSIEFGAAGPQTIDKAALPTPERWKWKRAVGVEGSLRQPGEEEPVAGIDRLIVGEHGEVPQDRGAHLAAVEQELHRQHEVRVVPRRLVEPHDEVGVVARPGLEDRVARGLLDASHGARIHPGGELHVARQQGVDTRLPLRDADELDLFQVGAALLPVVRVSY
jgi:hypothetical protein